MPTAPFRLGRFHLLRLRTNSHGHAIRALPVAALVLFGLLPPTPMIAPLTDSASAAMQPSPSPTPPAPGPGTLELQLGSASGERLGRARTSAEAFASAAPDLLLTPNEDGWPNFNPIIWTVTLVCPAGGPNCAAPLTMRHYSSDGGRFWMYGAPMYPNADVQRSSSKAARTP